MSQTETDAGGTSLSSFLPRFFREALVGRGGLPRQAEAREAWGIVIFADISGFTETTESLAPLGPRGAEQLGDALNRFFGRIVELADSHGGDVVAFAGDAAILLWRVDAEPELEGAAAVALPCALAIHNELSDFDPGTGPIRLRVSLGAGPIRLLTLGGVDDCWLPVVDGAGIADAVATHALAGQSAVCLSPRGAALAPAAARLDPGPEGCSLLRGWDREPRGVAPRAPVEVPWDLAAPLVPTVVRERLGAGQDAFLTEFRRVSVVFTRLSVATETSLDVLQTAVRHAQDAVTRFGGTTYQCLQDDKGFVLIAAFGMPPFSHEDDAARAVLAAIGIRDAPEPLSGVRAGVATGTLFCGAYGTSSRQQYSLVGPAINLAARLMQSGPAEVCCDSDTQVAAARQLELAPLPPVTLKGIEQPLPVFRPVGRAAPVRPADGAMLGREAELQRLLDYADSVLEGQREGAMVIEATAGMGKSVLLDAFIRRARALGIDVLECAADAIEQRTPYFALRDMFAGIVEQIGLEALQAGLPDRVKPLLPLLRDVIPVAVEANDTTSSLTGAGRQAQTRRLLLELLRIATRARPAMIVFEDGHWMDSATWTLFQALNDELVETGIVLSMRPLLEPQPTYDALKASNAVRWLRLDAMSSVEIARLAAERLGVDDLPTDVHALIVAKAAGNPFYAVELSLSLRDLGYLIVEDRRCRLAAGVEVAEIAVPETLSGLITSRVDVLPTPVQLTVKIASVIGRLFEDPMVDALQPTDSAVANIRTHLERLCVADLIDDRPEALTPMHVFRHDVTQETVYALLTFAQRRTLNRAAASYLERAFPELAPVYTRLAYHYREAELPREELKAVLGAGRNALRVFANTEAIGFFERALALDHELERGLTAAERAEVNRGLSAAHFALTNFAKVFEHGQTALRAAGFAELRGARGVPVELATAVLHSVRRRATGRRAPLAVGDRADACRYALQSIADGMPAMLHLGRLGDYLEAALRSHNMAAHIEPDLLASAAGLGYGLSLARMGLLRAGERQVRRAAMACQEARDEVWTYASYMSLGLLLTMAGKPREAAMWLDKGTVTPDNPASFIWHYRCNQLLAMAQICLGEYADAADSYARGIEIMRTTEPGDLGLQIAQRAIALIRLGRDAEAASIIDEAVERSSEHEDALPLATSLGALAEMRLNQQEAAEALELADTVTRIATSTGELHGYFQGIHSYTSAASVYLQLLEAHGADAPAGADRERTLTQLTALLKRFRRFARAFPGAGARYTLFEARRLHAAGRTRAGESLLLRTADAAEELTDPYTLGLARLHLGLYGDPADRERQLRAAARTFERYHLPRELAMVPTAR